MPLRGENHSSAVSDEAPYFTSLAALDDWVDKANLARSQSGVLQYTPRSELAEDGAKNRGKLLVSESQCSIMQKRVVFDPTIAFVGMP